MPKIIKPQAGYQEQALSSPADIVIGGAAAGVGKSFCLLFEPLKHALKTPGFGGVIFRRTTPQITNEGGLWDKSLEMYATVARPVNHKLTWIFNQTNCKIKFNHLEYDKTVLDHQGTEYCFIGFDELTHFSKKQFFYMLSRNRSTCGIKPYIRATCNPEPDSWVADLISWWIEPNTGLPIPERVGKLRYFLVDQSQYVWGDSKEEVLSKAKHITEHLPEDFNHDDIVKSITFIAGDIYSNKALMSKDPGYIGNLMALDEQEKSKLLHGSWKISIDGTELFDIDKLKAMFTNYPKEDSFQCITCDAARFGSNLAVVKRWQGWTCKETHIYTTSDENTLYGCIEELRKCNQIPASQVLIDQDGVGGFLVDRGSYLGFTNNASPVEIFMTDEFGNPVIDPETGSQRKLKESYQNLKTQCFFYLAKKVNKNEVRHEQIYFVDGSRAEYIQRGKRLVLIEDLHKQHLRVVKRSSDQKSHEKIKINSKEEQITALGDKKESPDLADCDMMRAYFDLVKKREDIPLWF